MWPTLKTKIAELSHARLLENTKSPRWLSLKVGNKLPKRAPPGAGGVEPILAGCRKGSEEPGFAVLGVGATASR